MDHKTATVEAAANILTSALGRPAESVSPDTLEWLGDWYDQGAAKAPKEKREAMFGHLLECFALAVAFVVAYRGAGSLEPDVELLELVEAQFVVARGPGDPTGLCRQ